MKKYSTVLFVALVFVVSAANAALESVSSSEQLVTSSEPIKAELIDVNQAEVQSLEEDDVIHLEIVDSEDELAEWFEETEGATAETVYVDEEGNEYYYEEQDVAMATKMKLSLKLKGPKARKRGCVASDGEASWYGPGFHGKKTANGERFNQNALTAAHKTIHFNSIVRVTYKGRSVDVRINDAGPYSGGRVIDLSKAAAAQLGMINAGHGHVKLEIISCGK